MKINKNDINNNIACLSVFILISTLYSGLDAIAYGAFTLLFLTLILLGSITSMTRAEVVFSLLILSTIFSLLTSIDFELSLLPSVYFLFVLLASVAISKSVNSLHSFEKLLFASLLGFIIFNLRNFSEDFSSLRFSGVVGQPNGLGLISGTGFTISTIYMYLFPKSRKIYKLVSLIVILTSFFLVISSGSRGALVSILIPLMYLFIKSIKNNFKTIIVLSISLFFVLNIFHDKLIQLPIYNRLLALPMALGWNIVNNNIDAEFATAADDTRVNLANIAFEAFLDKPIFGNGANTFSYFSEYVYTHNTYLEIIFSQGLVGTLAYTGFLIIILIKKPKYKNQLSVRMNKSKNFVLIYFILAGFSLPNFQNKSQIIIYSFLLITISLILYEDRKLNRSLA